MRSIEAAIIDVFTDEPLAGTPGAVVDGRGLTVETRAAVRTELGIPGVAFIQEVDGTEITLETHTDGPIATEHLPIAAVSDLFTDDSDTYTVFADDRRIELTGLADGRIRQSMGTGYTIETVDYSPIEKTLGVSRTEQIDLQPAIVTGQQPWLVVVVPYFKDLKTIDTTGISDLTDRYDVVGLYAATFETMAAQATAHARAIVPQRGDQPPTPSGGAAASVYLDRHDAIESTSVRIEQGHLRGRPGVLEIETGHDVLVGGNSVRSLSGTLSIPDPDDDEIIEA